MREEDILIEPDDGDSPFAGFLRRRHRPSGARVGQAILVLAVVALVAAGGWYLLRARGGGTAEPPAPVQTAGDPAPPGATPPAPVEEAPLRLPAVDTSDAFVRRMLARLSSHPEFARWLVSDELARRFVATIADLAQGASPAPHLRFMAPSDAFRVRENTGAMVIDPTGYLRYNAMTATFVSLDTDGTARLLRRMQPMLEDAHRELGFPDRTFEGDLARAIANVLAVEVPERPPVVVRVEDVWQFEDPALEARSTAAKHLLRMGPDNARRIQEKVLELAAALGIDTTH